MVSKSPDRNTFQKNAYIKRCEEKGDKLNEEYLKMFDLEIKAHDEKFSDPKSRENSMEYDLLTTDWILEKVRASESYAQNLYAAMCNNEFLRNDVWPLLQGTSWSCSWRYAGGIIADMRQQGDYIDWYCSGIRDKSSFDEENVGYTEEQKARLKITDKFVGEEHVTQEIREDLFRLGWIVVDDDDAKYV